VKAVWFFGLLALGILLALAAYLAPLHPPLVALQFTFSREAFDAITTQWGGQGVALFRSHLYPDFALMAAYALYGVCTVRYTRLFHMRFVPPIFWYAIMPLAALADVVENTLHLAITAPQAQPQDWWYVTAGISATLKSGLIVFFLVVAVQRGWVQRSRD
jgi:hypothetical protein